VASTTFCVDRKHFHELKFCFFYFAVGKTVHLWEFIRDILLDPEHCPTLIKWEDREMGVFRFMQSDVVASMWGEKKRNPKMTYEKLSRAMRSVEVTSLLCHDVIICRTKGFV